MSNDQVKMALKDKKSPELPDNCPDQMYIIILFKYYFFNFQIFVLSSYF
jgi:hypothetical protein